MTRIFDISDCGNSPKTEFIKKISIAFAQGDTDFLTARLTDKFVWDSVGKQRVEDHETFVDVLETIKSDVPLELIFEHVLTHRKEGAVNGLMNMSDGSVYAFSYFYEFRGIKIRKITSYVIKTG